MSDAAAIQSEFDRLASVESLTTFSHTDVYFPWMLRQLPQRVANLAEVGCGSGALTALLAPRSSRVLAIDLSPAMLQLARERCARWPQVEFLQLDANDWNPAPRSLDAIVSVATLHHLEPAAVLPLWKAALRPGGTLLILDVLATPGLTNLPMNALAAFSSRWRRWLRTGRLREDPRVRDAWAAHTRFDRLETIESARRIARAYVPGASVRHHLLWRYSIRFQAPGTT